MADIQRGVDFDTASDCPISKMAGLRRLVAVTMALVLVTGLVSGPVVSASPASMASNNPPTYNNLGEYLCLKLVKVCLSFTSCVSEEGSSGSGPCPYAPRFLISPSSSLPTNFPLV